MTNDVAISVKGISKSYTIAHGGLKSPSFREALVEKLKHPFRRQESETFWALKDVTFDIKRGDVVGIIGRNGAGKSTLLKILSRIVEPTKGEVDMFGRVGSLLEVGTGFHPELTGRENIYLNGAILGMRRQEIRRHFDEIVDFAEVEKFLDTPVKRYSSGMYVRLAFAVAAHLNPEILIVDEVLAVGDAQFQKKCLGKMRDAADRGRTVLFVSHSMGAVESLCSRAIVLERGQISFAGDVQHAIDQYFRTALPQSAESDLTKGERVGTGEARILSVHFKNDDLMQQTGFRMGEPLNITVKVRFNSPMMNPTFGINILTDVGTMVADCRSSHYGFEAGLVEGDFEYRVRIERVLLYPRVYVVEPWVADADCTADLDWVKNAASFEVTSNPRFLNGANVAANHGISYLQTQWSTGN